MRHSDWGEFVLYSILGNSVILARSKTKNEFSRVLTCAYLLLAYSCVLHLEWVTRIAVYRERRKATHPPNARPIVFGSTLVRVRMTQPPGLWMWTVSEVKKRNFYKKRRWSWIFGVNTKKKNLVTFILEICEYCYEICWNQI